jgi:uncharacterized DUF497 family protein
METRLRWIWDPAKAVSNVKKHGVSFEFAAHALGDPHAMTIPDPYPDEERWRTLCMASLDPVVVLFVVHTWPDDEDASGRIISARKATPLERRAYEQE